MRVLFAIVLLLVSATASLAAANIVVIMTDDQDDTGSMAYMPKTLSLIAQHGVTFKNSFVNLPLCGPSRASFLTGQAAHNHGIRANSPLDAGGWEAFKSKEANSLPVWLQAAGYKTALIGKYSEPTASRGSMARGSAGSAASSASSSRAPRSAIRATGCLRAGTFGTPSAERNITTTR